MDTGLRAQGSGRDENTERARTGKFSLGNLCDTGEAMSIPKRLLGCLMIFAVTFTSAPRATASAYDDHPKLVIILVLDQFRADYLERYRADFKGQGLQAAARSRGLLPRLLLRVCEYGDGSRAFNDRDRGVHGRARDRQQRVVGSGAEQGSSGDVGGGRAVRAGRAADGSEDDSGSVSAQPAGFDGGR